MLKIYTKTGDTGETSLFGGKRVSKASIRVETYGTVDELNSAIGAAIAQAESTSTTLSVNGKRKGKRIQNVITELEKIQHDLLHIGSSLANPSASSLPFDASRLNKRTEELEKFIDQLTAKLPELSNFILPGGGEAGSLLHLARTICRRTERRIVELHQKEHISNTILTYFNRLSDTLFTMARFVNHKEKKKETIWKKENV